MAAPHEATCLRQGQLGAVAMMSEALLKQDTDRVRDASDIIKVVAEYVRLRKAGGAGRFVGLCPFHQEKTPSFNVNYRRQFYKCFGCGAGGDVFKFVMAIEGLSFVRAKELLAARAGIPLSTQCWTPTERRCYARATADADSLAVRLADFALGSILAAERKLSELAVALIGTGICGTAMLSDLHRQVHLLRIARPQDSASSWREMRRENLTAANVLEGIGRNDRENAEEITHLVVDLLAQSQGGAAA
jgi:CHC2-type zinc finger protein